MPLLLPWPVGIVIPSSIVHNSITSTKLYSTKWSCFKKNSHRNESRFVSSFVGFFFFYQILSKTDKRFTDTKVFLSFHFVEAKINLCWFNVIFPFFFLWLSCILNTWHKLALLLYRIFFLGPTHSLSPKKKNVRKKRKIKNRSAKRNFRHFQVDSMHHFEHFKHFEQESFYENEKIANCF